MTSVAVDYAFVAAMGTAVGVGELASRYRDSPQRLSRDLAAWSYIVMNAVATVGALLLANIYQWDFGGKSPGATRATRVIVCGTGAMLLLRSALVVVRVGNRDYPAGPAAFVTAILSSIDRAIDRRQAQNRSPAVAEIMHDVSFNKSFEALPTYCLGLLENTPSEEQESLAKKVEALLKAERMTDQAKAYCLGIALVNLAGPDVLRAAKQALGDEIRA